jgi:hypothetical protein
LKDLALAGFRLLGRLGIDCTELTRREASRKIGLVFQSAK